MNQWVQISDLLLTVSFFLYFISTILYVVALTGKKFSNRDPKEHQRKFSTYGFWFAVLGLLSQIGYYVTRWIAGGHSPTSNMFEFIVFLSICIVIGFLVVDRIYKLPVLGAFVMPLALIMMAYGSMFPGEITPLIPSLRSYWLHIHVTTAALGEGILAVGFAAGLMYLIRTVDQSRRSKSTTWLEITISVVCMMLGFIIMLSTVGRMGMETTFRFPFENNEGQIVQEEVTYILPAIVAPTDAETIKAGPMEPLFEAPSWMKGVQAARKLNTVIWSVISGLALYGLIRLLLRKRVAAAIQPYLSDIEPDLIDEISYRAIAIGYPIFTLGGLIFAMIWAAEAWGRFWGWDPKEVWAFIVFLFYTAYLHLRLTRGWIGTRSAWMAVLGFVIILITLIFVNLVIAGLHSYAGV